ncbi:tetratricopeptide repeat protein 33 [Narcine bancroftii]|uniref:tetratricopeptide repeat protein 33 n=1 Tax=Narcine bancroftii TaxID=1343680 RepID=UPI0038312018
MTSFRWKRKVGEKVSKAASQIFEAAAADSGLVDADVDWLHVTKRQRETLLEDCAVKSKRLKEEGVFLSENGRYWEAVGRWDEAIQLTPDGADLYEMKAQVLMILNEVFQAVQAAETAVRLKPQWWEARQTLGRTQLGLGEVALALRSFQEALHMFPAATSLWEEDLPWALEVRRRQRELEETRSSRPPPVDVLPDYDFESDELVAACAAIAERDKHSQRSASPVFVALPGHREESTQHAVGFIQAR